MRIAVVGSGISGLVAAYLLSRKHAVTLFEANAYPGGHTNTVDVNIDGEQHAVDTGFIVYNEQNYPNFCSLLRELGVETQASQMSFSVRCEETGLEYNGTSVNALFAQRSNLFRPRFWRMIADILRFYRVSPRLLEGQDYSLSLGEYLTSQGYSREFIEWHIAPMGAAIWSSGPEEMQDFPARYFVEFFRNHGFLRLKDRPRWRVIKGGSRNYVTRLIERFRGRLLLNTRVHSIRRLTDAVELKSGLGRDRFDQVVIAVHSDQALGLLADPSGSERDVLGSIRYQANQTLLHRDGSFLPRRKLARASWNYHLSSAVRNCPSVTYYMNSLQSIDSRHHFCVTLNPPREIDPSKVLQRITYSHPVYTQRTLAAQKRQGEISGVNRTHYAGAYWGYGFHEDGVNSALAVARCFGEGLS